jgi:hypothetical protein
MRCLPWLTPIKRVSVQSTQISIDEEPADDEDLIDCPEGCGRQFREEALEKHTKVCKKVF